jgi:hydroxymethylpyrimidine/phosphomethylpyrimidine kinase
MPYPHTDIGADAVKIGMLYSAELIQVVSEQLKTHHAKNIVIDPVMVAQSGDRLLQDDAIEAIKKHLMPLADVVTPNIPEAQVLLNRKLHGLEDMQAGAKILAMAVKVSSSKAGIYLKATARISFIWPVRIVSQY